MNALPHTYNYAGHTIVVHHTHASLYKNHQLIGNYKTEAAARAQATRLQSVANAIAASDHHNRILQIWGK